MMFLVTLAAATMAPNGQAQPKPTTIDAAIPSAALDLAKVLNSEAIIVGDADSDEKVIALVPQLIAGSADLAALEKDDPGIILEFARHLMPITNRSWRERLPELQRRQAALYAKTFAEGELATLLQFYTSPTGRKLIAATMANVRPNAMLGEALASPDFKFGPASAITDIKAAVPAVLREMGPQDHAQLAKLASSGLKTKMDALAPRTQSIALAWMDESAPWEEAATQKLLETIIAKREAAK